MDMAELKASLEREQKALAQARDELKLQLHLGSMEVKNQWDELERKWGSVSAELKTLESQAASSAKDLGAAAKQLLGELKHGYERVREQLKG